MEAMLTGAETPVRLAEVKKGAQKSYMLGTLLLLGVVLLWVGVSRRLRFEKEVLSKRKPFLITYLCTATFTLYLIQPGYVYYKRSYRKQAVEVKGRRRRSSASQDSAREAHHRAVKNDDEDVLSGILGAGSVKNLLPHRPRSLSTSRSITYPASDICLDPPLTVNQTAALALLFCGLWFIANWAMNASLGYTSVSSTTILSSMSGFFTLAVGAGVGVESFTLSKLGSVAFSILGVIIVSKSDSDLNTNSSTSSPPHFADSPFDPRKPTAPLLGDSLALASALAYAFYVILLKVRIRDESRVSMTLFFGFVGLFNIFLIWPLGLVLHFTGVEKWEWPHGGKLWASIAINAMITFVSDALYLKAMLMTSPLAVTLGISLTIPFAMAGDIYRGTHLAGWKTYLGGALVLGSFVVNGLIDLSETEGEDAQGSTIDRLGVVDSGEREGLLSRPNSPHFLPEGSQTDRFQRRIQDDAGR